MKMQQTIKNLTLALIFVKKKKSIVDFAGLMNIVHTKFRQHHIVADLPHYFFLSLQSTLGYTHSQG